MAAPIRLTVVFSRGMSLRGWQQAGILERELAPYRLLRAHCERLTFLTYGDARDEALAASLPGVTVLTNRFHLSANLYSVLAPWLHRDALAGTTLVRTNQLNGAWLAVRIAQQTGARLIARGGFLWSDFMARLHPGSWRVNAARALERRVYTAADAIVTTTAADAETITRRYVLDPARVQVIPNFVDTHLFHPAATPREARRVLFIGRLEAQKNVESLIEAVRGLDVTLDIVGQGPLRGALEAQAATAGVSAQFHGVRPHEALPALMRRAALFVMPSHYEGHPKALLEAMACGLPVIGRHTPGIGELIRHDDTGWLCGTSAGELHSAIAALLADAPRRDRLGAAAAAFVQDHCSLDAVAASELALWRSLTAQ